MTERMSAADVAFLHRETRSLPQHVGGLAVFEEPVAGFDYDRLVRLLEERISLAPRYRQKVRMVPGHLAHPVWVDDPAFDITYHVRRSALPRPGDEAALLEFCARIQSRMLDRARPLWEMYLVEGLSGGRLAIVTKTHEAMITEAGGIDIAEVILDAAPAPRRTVEALWMPEPEPSSADLVRDAVGELVRRPFGVLDTARSAGRDARTTLARAGALAGGVGRAVAAAGTALSRRPDTSPLSVAPGEQRRVAIARTRLADYRTVRDVLGGTVNDVVLAVVTGALRGWLLSRALPAHPVRALVPVSTTDAGQVTPLLVDLPVAEPDPVLRLAQIRYAMSTHHASGRAVGAEQLVALSGFAPPTMHALAARTAAGLARRMFTLVVTNVPGPQHALYAAGARMTEMFPIQPLGAGQALTIALTSYDGGVYFGLHADRDALPDLRTLAELLEESLAELLAAAETAVPSSASVGPVGQDGPVGRGRPVRPGAPQDSA